MLHNVRAGIAAHRRAIRRRIGELLHPPEPFPAGRDGYPCSARVLSRVPFAAATMTCGHPLGLASVLGRELAGEPAVRTIASPCRRMPGLSGRLSNRLSPATSRQAISVPAPLRVPSESVATSSSY